MQFLYVCLLTLSLFSQEMLTRTQVHMGTFVHITLASQYNRQISEAFIYTARLNHSLSSYENNLVYKLNATHKVSYDATLAQAIKLSQVYYKNTNGYFDITIGSISKDLYHFGEDNATIPSVEALQKAKIEMHDIHITRDFIQTKKGITIDLGGMGKGYAVDRVVMFLEEQNISKGVVAFSGDIRCLNICEVELQSPFSEQTFAALQAKNPHLSISTSGTYRRYVQNQKHHHLIDPKTAKQGKAFVSVSLLANANNAKIDAYATALSVMSKEQALAFLKKHEKIGFVLVENTGNILYGNLSKFVDIKWLSYKENASIAKRNKNTKTNNPIKTSLIHPDVTNPNMISR